MDNVTSDYLINEVNRYIQSGGSTQSLEFVRIVVPELASEQLSKLSVSPERQSFLRKYLPQVLTVVAEKQNMPLVVASVLGGLHSTAAWRDCLTDELRSYSLASALLTYVGSHTFGFALDDATHDGICAILNEWLKPAHEWKSVPRSSVVAQHMFGHAWCDLFLPDNADLSEDGTTPETIAARMALADKPPFLPGLCTFSSDVSSMVLPVEIGMAH